MWMWFYTQLSNNFAIFKIASGEQCMAIWSLTVIWNGRKSLASHCSPFQTNKVLKDTFPESAILCFFHEMSVDADFGCPKSTFHHISSPFQINKQLLSCISYGWWLYWISEICQYYRSSSSLGDQLQYKLWKMIGYWCQSYSARSHSKQWQWRWRDMLPYVLYMS